ncbi:MAG: transposase, partial [Nitrospira sp.]|nr:transposase [Nitrospira sp.]
MATTTRRQFTDAFKSEAVRLTRASGRPVAQVARELGISDNVLYRWRSEQLSRVIQISPVRVIENSPPGLGGCCRFVQSHQPR